MQIDNDPIKEESELLSYTLRIYHDFYSKNDITLLLASLAPDVSWCGGGPQMMRTGRSEVMQFFVFTKEEMIPFAIHNETTAVHRLSADFINIIIASDLQTLPSTPLFLKEHLKCDILYRKKIRIVPMELVGKSSTLIILFHMISLSPMKPLPSPKAPGLINI